MDDKSVKDAVLGGVIPSWGSDFLRVFSFVATLLVVYIHSVWPLNGIEGADVNGYVQRFLSDFVARVAVPYFFMVSGYFFWKKALDGSLRVETCKRVRSLVVPYLISAPFFPLFFYVMSFFPFTKAFLNSSPAVFLDSLFDTLYTWYVSSGDYGPLGFHLWYVRDLIAMVFLVSPVVWLVLRFAEGVGRRKAIIGCVAVLALVVWCLPEAVVHPYFARIASSCFWFFGGALLVPLMLNGVGRSKVLVWLSVALMSVDFYRWVVLNDNATKPAAYLALAVLAKLYVFVTIYRRAVPSGFVLSEHRVLGALCALSFSVYLYHEPSLNIVRKLIAAAVGPFAGTSVSYLVSYLLAAPIYYALAASVAWALCKYLPKVASVLFGGRVLKAGEGRTTE